MLTVEQFVADKNEEFSRAVGDDGKPRYTPDQQRRMIREALTKRGFSMSAVADGKTDLATFSALTVPFTVDEHVADQLSQGKTREEARLDMVNRGFYDLDANLKAYKDRLVPEILTTPTHLNRMKTWERDYASGSSFTYGTDPYEITTLQRSLVRQKARETEARGGPSAEYLPYLEWLNEKETLSAGAMAIPSRGMGNLAGIRKLSSLEAREPKVSAEAKSKAERIFSSQVNMSFARTEGAATGLGAGLYKTLDEAFGWDLEMFKDDEQTRYTRIPMIDDKGRAIRDKKTGKPKYTLQESPEEMLKFNLEDHSRLSRYHLDQIAALRNSGTLSLPGKFREEGWDLIQGSMMMSKMFIPLLGSLTAGAIAADEDRTKGGSFDMDDVLFEQKLQGFQNVQGMAGGLHAYFEPIMNSLTGGEGLTYDQVTGPPELNEETGEWDAAPTSVDISLIGKVELPFMTEQLKGQLSAFPLDGILSALSVTKFLGGLGSKAAMLMHRRQLTLLKKAGMSPDQLAKFDTDALDKMYTKQQKTYLRRIMESSVGLEADNALANSLPQSVRKHAGSIGDIGTAAMKGLVLGDIAGGLPNEGVIVASGSAVLSAASQLIQNLPSVKRVVTPAIHASDNPYSERGGKVTADRVAKAQNHLDAAATGLEYQLKSGDRIDLANLPAHGDDNVARITAHVDLDPDVVAAKALLDDFDPDSAGYASSLDKFDELRNRKFNEYAEAGEFVIEETGVHKHLTNLNRERNGINHRADEAEVRLTDDARISMSRASRDAARSTDLEGDIARVDSELAALDGADAARASRLNDDVNNLERVNTQKQRDSYISRTAADDLDSVRSDKQKKATSEYNEGVKAARHSSDEGVAASSSRRLELEAEKAVFEEQIILRDNEADSAALFAEGLIDADEFAARRAQRPEVSAVEVHAAKLEEQLALLRDERAKALGRNLDERRATLEALREDYRNVIRYNQTGLRPDKLVKVMRNHVFFDDSGNLTWLSREDVDGAVTKPGTNHGAVTFESSGSRASVTARRLSNLPVDEQLPVLALLEDAAKDLAKAGGGLNVKKLRGGGKNALYMYYYDSLARHVFDQYSPKLLRSPTMRKKFSRFVAKELGRTGSESALLHIEEMINDIASPRHQGGDFFVEPAYSVYGPDGIKIADLADLLAEFAIKEMNPKELRRVALEALQTEIPTLQARVGANVAANSVLESSGTTMQALQAGPMTGGVANIGYITSVAKVFDKEGSLPITFNPGAMVKVDDIPFFQGSGRKTQLEVAIATNPTAKRAALVALGEGDAFDAGRATPKFDALLRSLEHEIYAKENKKWVFLDNDDVMVLPEVELYGAGRSIDESPGVKTLHPAVDARSLDSAASALKGDSSGFNQTLIRKDYSDTIGWVLRTAKSLNDPNQLLKFGRLFTGLWKLGKTGLNLINLTTNGISNFITMMLSEAIDPATASAIFFKGGVDMFTYISNPMAMSVTARNRMSAILKTSGINNTILVKEVRNVFSELAGDKIFGRAALDFIHSIVTGRSMEGIPFGSTRGGRLEAPGHYSTALQRKYSDIVQGWYRQFGDELAKYTKATLEMEKNAVKLSEMAVGSSEKYFDIAKGAYAIPETMGSVTKMDNGDLLIRHSDGSITRGPMHSKKMVKAFDEFNAEVSMSSANSYYYNLGDLGKGPTFGRKYEGVIYGIPAFLSWRAKSFDIPYVKKGLFYRTMIDDVYSISSDPVINSKIIDSAVARSVRRNLLLLGMRKRELDNDDIRRLLPEWLANGAIYGDLSSIVSNNQIPWSMYLDVLTYADSLSRWASAKTDPGFAAEHALFGELAVKPFAGSQTGLPIVDFFKTAIGVDPFTGKEFDSRSDQLRSVMMQIGGGLVNMPRKAIELFYEQEGVVTVGELEGMDKKLIQKRQLMGEQQRSVAVFNALLFNRYRDVNPDKLIDKLMSFPDTYINAMHKRILSEWKINIFDKDFDINNPSAYFAEGKRKNTALAEVNMENLEREMSKISQFFTKDKAYLHVTDRMIKGMIYRMDRVNAKRFGAKYKKLKAKSLRWKDLKESAAWTEKLDNQQTVKLPEPK